MAKRPKSRLDTLLRIRGIEEDRAKAALAAANAQVRAAEAGLAAARENYLAREREERNHLGEAPLSLTDFHARQLSGAAVAARVVSAQHDRAESENDAAHAREDVRVAAMRTQGLTRLVERFAAEHEAKVLAADQRTAEESRAGKTTRGRS